MHVQDTWTGEWITDKSNIWDANHNHYNHNCMQPLQDI